MVQITSENADRRKTVNTPAPQQTVIGNTLDVTFISFNKTIEAKIDTGADTCSLHATNIKVSGQQVSFSCDALSSNVITLPLQGTQEVHSADAGGVQRPIVVLDIMFAGKELKEMTFNLNDRSNMDSRLLIGQNVLKAADVLIDPTADDAEEQPPVLESTDPSEYTGLTEEDLHIIEQRYRNIDCVMTENLRQIKELIDSKRAPKAKK